MRYGCSSTRVYEKMKDKQDFLEREYLTHFRDDGQFYRWCYFNGNLMVSNNITIVFGRPFSFHITAVYTEACIQLQFSGQCNLCIWFLGQFLGQCGLNG